MRGEPKIVKQLLQKAKDSALLAIEYYNKPAVSFKSEGFIVMMCIAWNSFFHAYFLKNKIKPYYRKKENGKKTRFETIIEKLPDGKEIKDKKWWDLSKCIKEFYKDKNDPVKANIQFLTGVRNLIVHRNLPELDSTIFAECQASVFNFNEYLDKYFGKKHKIDVFLSFSIQLFQNPKNFIDASKKELKQKDAIEIVDYIKSFRSALSTDIIESPNYSFKAVLIQVKNHESNDALALRFVNEKDLTDEQKEYLKNIGIVLVKEKVATIDGVPQNFSWLNKDLKENIKKDASYIPYKYFEKLKAFFKIKYNNQYVYERIHNPKSKKTTSTFYYDPMILKEFKKYCPPITPQNEGIVLQIEALVDKILQTKKQNSQTDTNRWEREIDRLVYGLYGLTEEEVRIVENKK